MTDSKKELITELKNKIEELEKKIDDSNSAELSNEPLKSIYSWEAHDRITMSDNKNWYLTVSVISVLSILFSLLTQNFLLVVIIIGLVFIVYLINTSTPLVIKNHITNKGIRISNELYSWVDIKHFWISERNGHTIINLELIEQKGRIFVLIGDGDVYKIVNHILEYEEYKEPKGIINSIAEGKVKKITEFMKDKDDKKKNKHY